MSDIEIYMPTRQPDEDCGCGWGNGCIEHAYACCLVDEKSLVLAGDNMPITAGEWRRRVLARRVAALMTAVNAGVAVWGFAAVGPLLGMIFTFLFVVGLLATFVVPFEGIRAGE
jgi:hypothetical protein